MKDTKVLIYTHAVDLDGWTSGALVKLMHELAHPIEHNNVTYTIKEWTYSREEPKFEKLIGYDYFYLTDLHFSTKLMAQLFNHYMDKFIWLDHHKKSINDFYNEWKDVAEANDLYVPLMDNRICCNINGIQSDEFAACGLTWNYFMDKIIAEGTVQKFTEIFKEFKYSKLFDVDIFTAGPIWLRLIDSYDRWNNSDKNYWNKYVMPFQFYMRSRINSVDKMLSYINSFEDVAGYINNDIGYTTAKVEIDAQIYEGNSILSYQKILYKNQWKTGYKTTLENYNVFVLNTQDRGSIIFEDMPDKDNYDLFVPWYFDGTNYNYSMYTFRDDVDCAELCAKYISGSGHRKASGGKSKELIFKK